MPDVEKFFSEKNRTARAKQAFQLMFQQNPNPEDSKKILQEIATEWRQEGGSVHVIKRTLTMASNILGTNPPPAAITPALNNAAINVRRALKFASNIQGVRTIQKNPLYKVNIESAKKKQLLNFLNKFIKHSNPNAGSGLSMESSYQNIINKLRTEKKAFSESGLPEFRWSKRNYPLIKENLKKI